LFLPSDGCFLLLAQTIARANKAGGSASAVGDLMMSRTPEIHKDRLTAARYG
jgi:hypothetical protein